MSNIDGAEVLEWYLLCQIQAIREMGVDDLVKGIRAERMARSSDAWPHTSSLDLAMALQEHIGDMAWGRVTDEITLKVL